jgi:hypothetical protein
LKGTDEGDAARAARSRAVTIAAVSCHHNLPQQPPDGPLFDRAGFYVRRLSFQATAGAVKGRMSAPLIISYRYCA